MSLFPTAIDAATYSTMLARPEKLRHTDHAEEQTSKQKHNHNILQHTVHQDTQHHKHHLALLTHLLHLQPTMTSQLDSTLAHPFNRAAHPYKLAIEEEVVLLDDDDDNNNNREDIDSDGGPLCREAGILAWKGGERVMTKGRRRRLSFRWTGS